MDAENALADIEAMVVEAVREGAHTLVDVTSRVLPALPNSTHYAATGRVADALARLAAVHAERERPWARVQERLEIEDWTVSGREGVS
jgi:chromosome partition protein MukF